MLARIVAVCLFLVGLACIAPTLRADMMLTGVGGGPVAAAAGAYQGPGDIVSGAAAFWSCGRAYTAAFAATQGAICSLVDTATGAASCTLNVGTNGFANLTANVCVGNTVSVTTFCTVTHAAGCSITEMFDQTGNGIHLTNITLASMPIFSLNAQNSLPCASNLSGAGSLSLANNPGTSGPTTTYAMTVVGGVFGNFTTQQAFFGINTLNINATTTSGQWRVNFGTPNNITGVANSAMHAVVASTAPIFDIDGTSNSNNNGANTIQNSTIQLLQNGGGATPMLNGYACEAGVWANNMSGTYASMITNMRSPASGWNF